MCLLLVLLGGQGERADSLGSEFAHSKTQKSGITKYLNPQPTSVRSSDSRVVLKRVSCSGFTLSLPPSGLKFDRIDSDPLQQAKTAHVSILSDIGGHNRQVSNDVQSVLIAWSQSWLDSFCQSTGRPN